MTRRFSRLTTLCGLATLTLLAASPKAAQAQTTAASFTGGTVLTVNNTVTFRGQQCEELDIPILCARIH